VGREKSEEGEEFGPKKRTPKSFATSGEGGWVLLGYWGNKRPSRLGDGWVCNLVGAGYTFPCTLRSKLQGFFRQKKLNPEKNPPSPNPVG